jgi:chromosome segregation ATPase
MERLNGCGEKRQLIDDCRTESMKFRRLEVEKKIEEGELTAYRSGVEQLLKAKQSLQQGLGEAESRNERVETSESTLRYHVVGSRAKLRESRANFKVLQERLDRSQLTAERLTGEKKFLGKYLVASSVKLRELQVECEALSDSLDDLTTPSKGCGASL